MGGGRGLQGEGGEQGEPEGAAHGDGGDPAPVPASRDRGAGPQQSRPGDHGGEDPAQPGGRPRPEALPRPDGAGKAEGEGCHAEGGEERAVVPRPADRGPGGVALRGLSPRGLSPQGLSLRGVDLCGPDRYSETGSSAILGIHEQQ